MEISSLMNFNLLQFITTWPEARDSPESWRCVADLARSSSRMELSEAAADFATPEEREERRKSQYKSGSGSRTRTTPEWKATYREVCGIAN